ncbi:S-adenosyl-L-methionine-dependent methyltransferase [Clohesyomyces aquaticus]|uniref:S-adenosyl-L-methionine-dependent methyltransferase n=1 Tax=Clohesyomyces aquaticus TaxID=1231657 RepID=A0A1Y1YIZ9_9PLEO|nr:S-adenosyl-L-methionine-dependent methyltransferase [Clohesyomyces aquaticus]
MDEEPPQPDDLDIDHTAAPHKRQRTDSESSTSVDSIPSYQYIQEADVEQVHENGRVYGNNDYFLPCDQSEQDRLSWQHEVFVHTLKGKLTTTRITPSTKRILDLGTGPGHWAIAISQQYPHAEVVGLDLTTWDIETTEAVKGHNRVTWEINDLDVWGSPKEGLKPRFDHQNALLDPAGIKPVKPSPTSKGKETVSSASNPPFNPSVLESEPQPGWDIGEPYDFIHLRDLKGAFTYWEDVYPEIYRNLSPGGWVEVADYEVRLPGIAESGDTSDMVYSSTPRLPTVERLYKARLEASANSGRPFGSYYMHPTYLEDAGFKDVKATQVNVPVGPWAEDEDQKKLGKIFLVLVYMESLEPQCLRLLTKYGDFEKKWTVDEVHEAVEQAKKEILQLAEQAQCEGWCANFKWIVGRKSKNA